MILENEYNIIYSLKKIQRIMKKYKIICPHRKANPYKKIAKATKEHRAVPNLLERNFKQDIHGLVLMIDITYLPYGDNDMAYLSTVLDASTGELLAHHISKRITLDIAIETIIKLKKQTKVKLNSNAFIHSDQESFFGHLKDSVKSKNCNSYEELKSEINRYIIYYNNYRYKWNQKKMTPVQYRNHLLCA